jgi:ABC-type amino acid transport substrate-binding protein
VTGIEAAAVADLARALPDDARRRLAARAARPAPDRCPALEPDGGCAIYAARPLVCRSHGLPIRLRDGRGLPVVESCPLNWRAGAANAPPAAILDQETLSTVLLALDAAHAAAQGRPAGARVDLAALLAEALSGDVPAPVSGPRR